MSKLLFLWLMATIGVAALTREAPHATRSFFLLFPLIIFSAQGLIVWKKLLPLILLCTLWFLSSYFIRFPIAYAKQWRSADAAVTQYIFENQNKYDRIIIDKKSGFIYTSYLFYTKYSPQKFQETVVRQPDDPEGFSEVISFGKIEYKEIIPDDYRIPSALIITTPGPVSHAIFTYPNRPVVIAHKQQILQYPTQEVAYVAIETE